MHASLWLLASGLYHALAQSAGGTLRDPAGMEHFVTRPELISPQLMVTKYHPEAITPGYWFITPYYVTNQRQRADTKEYIPCQTGAHIYDGDGQLIWSGACQYDNRNIFAFQPVTINGTQHLSFWLGHQFIGDPATIAKEEVPSSAVLMDNSYREVRRVFQFPFLDCHEVSFQPDGKTILITRLWKEEKDLAPYGKMNAEVLHGGFRELDLATDQPIFDWDPVANNVTLDESCDKSGKGSDVGDAWDYFHINSIDKNADGDYLISARHTSTIYKISGKDGSIMWRLGGYFSDFEMEDRLAFHWQHHARLLYENATHAIVSVFDNAGDDFGRNPDIPQEISAGKIMLLDTASTPKTAKMLRRFDRPDGQRSPMGGSVFLAGGEDPYTANVLVNWVIPGYFSEYDAQDRLVFEARFGSQGIKTYRAFKSDFVGHPTEPIAFKLFPLGYSTDEVATSFYVSWNGATEVREWALHGSDKEEGPFALIKTVKKRGFETSWVMPGVVRYAYAVALDKNGESLGQSATVSLEPPAEMNGRYQVRLPVLEDAKLMHGNSLTFDPAAPQVLDSAVQVPKVVDADQGFPPASADPHHLAAAGSNIYAGDSGANSLSKPAAPGSAPLGSASEKVVEQQLQQQQQQSRIAPPLPSSKGTFSQLVIEAFAVFGLFCIARTLLHRRTIKRARGYSASIFADVES